MKHLTLLTIVILLGFAASTQTPLTFPYQALVRDASGNPLANHEISAKITLIADNIAGLAVFSETQTVNTNSFGQMEILIGSENTAAFDTIPWGLGTMFIKLEVDLEGGNNYQEIGTHQLLAVPYAKYAEEGSGWKKTENGIQYKNGKVHIGSDTLLSVPSLFHVSANSASNGVVYISNADTTSNSQAVFRVDARADDQHTFRIQRNGKIGVGLSNPKTNMQIQGNSISDFEGTTRGILALSTDYQEGYFTALDFLYSQSSHPTARIAALHDGSGSQLRFGTSDHYSDGITNTAMSIDSWGRVGIGTTNPGGYRLYVNGNFYASNMKTSSLELQTYLQKRNTKKVTNLVVSDISDIETIIEQDTLLDLGKMNMFLLEKIDQIIQNNIRLQSDNERQQKENEAQNHRFEKLEAEIENLKNK